MSGVISGQNEWRGYRVKNDVCVCVCVKRNHRGEQDCAIFKKVKKYGISATVKLDDDLDKIIKPDPDTLINFQKKINIDTRKENNEKKIKKEDEISKLIKAFPKDIAALDKRSVLAKVNSQGSGR